ncbi:hypothetical protein [Paenibacillus taichungensis]|uniref:hypothetical protein n=1 Tax=Paenibacillus taichungensis TaxID=484184 RepID=UPI0039A21EB8
MKTLNVYNSSNTKLTICLYGASLNIEPKQTVQIKTDVWFKDDNFRVVDNNPQHDWKEAYTGRHSENIIFRQANEIPTYSQI